MNEAANGHPPISVADVLPHHRDLFYDGAWQRAQGGYASTFNPATGEALGQCAVANASDVDAAARVAHRAFVDWRRMRPLDRGAVMRTIAASLRVHADELALIDAAVVTYSVESLPSLAVYLTHADATVREAARDGFLQMGLTEGAAHLRAAADKTRDPREAVQLLDAADFLDLPSVPMTGGRELIPVSPQTRERMERERAAKKSGANSPR